MDITLNKNWNIDELKDLISTRYSDVKKCDGYLKVNHKDIVLTVYPKKNNVYGINRDVPILKSLFIIFVIVMVELVVLVMITPLIGKISLLLLATIPAVAYGVYQSLFKKKGESAVKEFCSELKAMTEKAK